MTSFAILSVAVFAMGAAPAEDAASPMGVAMAFARAMDVGDAVAAKTVTLRGDEHTRLVDAMAAMTRSQQRLLKVATARFGASAKTLVGPYAAPGVAATVARSKLMVDGDTAVLREQPGMIFLKLRRVDGRWRVDVAGSSEADTRKTQIPLLEDGARLCEAMADQVAAGKYASTAEAWHGMIDQIRAQNKSATSRATTKPATGTTRP